MPAIENPTALAPEAFWDLYASKIVQTAIYPGQGSVTGLNYVSLGLAGETGEFCDQVKKIIRDDGNALTPERRAKLWSELGDVCWYMGGAAREIEIPLSACVRGDAQPWVREPIIGRGTPTAISMAARRLLRGVDLFGQTVDQIIATGASIRNRLPTIQLHLTSIYHCVTLCASTIDADPRQIGADNVDKLFSRRDRGVLQGSGSDR